MSGLSKNALDAVALESGETDVETLYKKIGIGLRSYDRPSVI